MFPNDRRNRCQAALIPLFDEKLHPSATDAELTLLGKELFLKSMEVGQPEPAFLHASGTSVHDATPQSQTRCHDDDVTIIVSFANHNFCEGGHSTVEPEILARERATQHQAAAWDGGNFDAVPPCIGNIPGRY